MKRFDFFTPGSDQKPPLPVVISSTVGCGKKLSPHVVNMTSRSEEQWRNSEPETTQTTPERPQRWSFPGPRLKLSRELKRMSALGMAFFALLFAGNFIGKVRLFAGDVLPDESARIKNEISELSAELHKESEKNPLAALAKFSEALGASALFIEQYAQEPAGDAKVESGFSSATDLLESARLLSASAAEGLSAKTDLEAKIPALFSGQESFLTVLDLLATHAENIGANLEQVDLRLEKVQRGFVPKELASRLVELQGLVNSALEIKTKFTKSLPALRTLLGAEHPHTIFVLLQNRNELRATGGFPGNTLQIVLNQGKIYSWEMTDIFHYSGQSTADLPVPDEFAGLTGGWFIHDCNRDPDFPTAAEECRFLLEHSKGDTPDTVIALHQDLLRDLLALTGPIRIPEAQNLELSAENFSFTLSYVIEAKIFGQGGANSPKKFLTTLIPILLEKVRAIAPQEIVKLGEKWIHSKYFQIYSRDAALEPLWKELGVSGAYFPEEKDADFLGIVQSNVGGNKSDAFMQQEINETSLVNLNGELFHTVKVHRQHTWGAAQEAEFNRLFDIFGAFKIDREALRAIMGAGANKVFTTVYLPKGARLLSTTNTPLEKVRTTEGENWTSFSFFFPEVAAGSEQEVELFIAAPQKIDLEKGIVLPFSALFQSGSGEQYFSKDFVFESGVGVEGTEFQNERFDHNLESVYLIRSE